jgi:hypothetical protein
MSDNSAALLSIEKLFGKSDQQWGIEGVIPDASSGEGVMRSFEQCQEWAEKFKCELKTATDKQLFVDLDTEVQWQIFQHQIKLLKKHFYFVGWKVLPSKQGLPHRHVTVEMVNPYDLITRIALQACLGSDPTRELLSIRRAMNQEENVVIFFEPKEVTK